MREAYQLCFLARCISDFCSVQHELSVQSVTPSLGGAGVLSGGQGSDKFVFTEVAGSTPIASDLITDFVHGSDSFDFSTIDANTSKGGNEALVWRPEHKRCCEQSDLVREQRKHHRLGRRGWQHDSRFSDCAGRNQSRSPRYGFHPVANWPRSSIAITSFALCFVLPAMHSELAVDVVVSWSAASLRTSARQKK